MKVLIACEYSGTVRDAFIRNGHDAISCDLLECEPSPNSDRHIRGPVEPVLAAKWDLIIAHPPCTYICNASSLRLYKKPYSARIRDEDRFAKLDEACNFFNLFLKHDCPKICIENPIPHGHAVERFHENRKFTQTIQPWQFGHDASKRTCLWLKGLPELKPTKIIKKPAWIPCPDCGDYLCTIHGKPGAPVHAYDCDCPDVETWIKKKKKFPYEEGGPYANQTPSGQNKLGPSSDRWKLRSKTYEGIARAMADQWGGTTSAAVAGDQIEMFPGIK